MIKKTLGFVLVAALITSCGSQFNKSKYGGYMWNRSAAKSQVEKIENNSNNTSSQNIQDKNEDSKNSVALNAIDNNDSNELLKASTIESKKSNGISTNKITKNNHNAYTKVNKAEKPGVKLLAKKLNKKVNNHKPYKGGDVDAMWVVTLILCFFIPPLGVYLKDGSITGLFWLVLVLCLLGGGILFGFPGYLGGLYGVAVILALLRFFDII